MTARGRQRYFVLTMVLSDRALRLPKGPTMAWRRPIQYFEGTEPDRLHAMLQKVMRPETFPQDARGFEAEFKAWEIHLGRWELLNMDVLSDGILRQFLVGWPQQPVDSVGIGRPCNLSDHARGSDQLHGQAL